MSASNEALTGRFWFADAPDVVVPGRLDFSRKRPRAELFGALTPDVEELPTTSSGTRTFVPASFGSPRTLHGEVLGTPRRVTLVDVREASRRSTMFAFANGGLQQQTLDARYAIMGAHIADDGALFPAFRYRVCFQDAWAHLSGLTMHRSADPSVRKVAFGYEEPESVVAALPGDAGSLTLEASSKWSPLRVAGAYILQYSWLKVDLASGATVGDAWARFVLATSTFLTLLHGKDCPPIDFEVYDSASSRWCRVHMPGLVPDPTDVRSPKIDERALLVRGELGLERVAAWFDLASRLSPLPEIVAGAIQATDRTVQNLLLELATAAEGLHRRLYPDARSLTEEEKEEALSALRQLEVNHAAKQILLTAMNIYLWDMSFPKRLKQLAVDVTVAVPGVVGKTNKWRDAVRDARNGFAHSLQDEETSETKILAYHTLQASLRWLLTGRILLELGVPAELIAERLREYERYRRFLRNAKEDLPSVYG